MPETKKYSVIYADPPWRYDMKRGNGVAENHYPTMSMSTWDEKITDSLNYLFLLKAIVKEGHSNQPD